MDDGSKKSRYSVLKSAATIAVISVAVGAVAATAGTALLPEAVALETVCLTSHRLALTYVDGTHCRRQRRVWLVELLLKG